MTHQIVGFRPKRSARQAIYRTKQYYEEGYIYVVDLRFGEVL